MFRNKRSLHCYDADSASPETAFIDVFKLSTAKAKRERRAVKLSVSVLSDGIQWIRVG